jgi:hypothetical protein
MSLFFPPIVISGGVSTNDFIINSTISSVVTFDKSVLVTLTAQELQWTHFSTLLGITHIENPNADPLPAINYENVRSTTLGLANPVSSSILLNSSLFER